MTLGTPPQPFRAVIDISSPDVIVTSSKCSKERDPWSEICNRGHYQYHPTWSKTGTPSNKLFVHECPVMAYYARVTRDSFSIAGIEVEDQGFHEALDILTPPIGKLMDAWDGVLGLAIDDGQSPVGLKGPFTNMIKRGLVDSAIVSIMLGRWNEDIWLVPGEIAFGGVNEDLIKPNTSIRFLPVSNRTDSPESPFAVLNSTWQVEAQSVGFTWFNKTSGENETIHHELPLETGTARFDTAMPSIALPRAVADELAKIAKPRFHDPEYWTTIPCNRVPSLPALVFKLGGEEFVLPPEDYVLEGINGRDCQERGLFMLGSAFLRSYYVVLDRERRNIGFGEPAWRDWLRKRENSAGRKVPS
ncbi:acid protease [Thozetella sp. PMI_491]|nr:acid protease [Thozetella sp. PMI_491]